MVSGAIQALATPKVGAIGSLLNGGDAKEETPVVAGDVKT